MVEGPFFCNLKQLRKSLVSMKYLIFHFLKVKPRDFVKSGPFSSLLSRERSASGSEIVTSIG